MCLLAFHYLSAGTFVICLGEHKASVWLIIATIYNNQMWPNGLTNRVRIVRVCTVIHAKICACTDSSQSWHEKDKTSICFLRRDLSAVSEKNLMCCLSCVHFWRPGPLAVPLKDYAGDRIDKTLSCLLWGLQCLMMPCVRALSDSSLPTFMSWGYESVGGPLRLCFWQCERVLESHCVIQVLITKQMFGVTVI